MDFFPIRPNNSDKLKALAGDFEVLLNGLADLGIKEGLVDSERSPPRFTPLKATKAEIAIARAELALSRNSFSAASSSIRLPSHPDASPALLDLPMESKNLQSPLSKMKSLMVPSPQGTRDKLSLSPPPSDTFNVPLSPIRNAISLSPAQVVNAIPISPQASPSAISAFSLASSPSEKQHSAELINQQIASIREQQQLIRDHRALFKGLVNAAVHFTGHSMHYAHVFLLIIGPTFV